MAWTCPECERSFGRRNQSHGCAPSTTVDAFFATRPPVQRRIYDAVERHVRGFEGAHVDPVGACVMFKRERSFAEIRAKRDRLELGFLLSRALDDPRIRKTLRLSAHRTAHFVDLVSVADVDRTVRGWLAEAYETSPTQAPAASVGRTRRQRR